MSNRRAFAVASLLVALLLAVPGTPAVLRAAAETPAADAAHNAALLDEIYAQIEAASDRQDAAAVASYYAEDALYMSPDSKDFLRGRAAIQDGFKVWMAYLDKNGMQAKMESKVLYRRFDGDLGYDVGYARSVTEKKGEAPKVQVWKFCTIFSRDHAGVWKIQVDSNIPAPAEVWPAAAAAAVPATEPAAAGTPAR